MVLNNASSRSCPGPDPVPYPVWKAARKVVPDFIPGILSTCLQFGFHPTRYNSANGFVFPKSGKSDYITPRSFRVIVLLDTFSKIPEETVQTRLSHGPPEGHVSAHKAGSLPGASAKDAAARLMHEVDAAYHTGLCATTDFFDIKGGFDNISLPILLDRLTSPGAPPSSSPGTDPSCRTISSPWSTQVPPASPSQSRWVSHKAPHSPRPSSSST